MTTEHPKSAFTRLVAQGKLKNIEVSDAVYNNRFEIGFNKNYFNCEIRTIYNGIEEIIKTREFLTKKECERDAYEQLLNFVYKHIIEDGEIKTPKEKKGETTQTKSVEHISEWIFKKRDCKTIYVLIDLENVPKINVDTIEKVVNSNKNLSGYNLKIAKIAGFCSTVTNFADFVVRSNRKDAVDHFITYIVGMIEAVKNMVDTKIYIITRDKFGSCLQDFCQNVSHCLQ